MRFITYVNCVFLPLLFSIVLPVFTHTTKEGLKATRTIKGFDQTAGYKVNSNTRSVSMH